MNIQSFQQAVLTWFNQQGRKTLPWQQNKTPYRVWVSEIMLQQTQVNTVIPYFNRFINTFPTVESLALAEEDEVLHLWTGLGYYSRARNLHRSAKIILEKYQGIFPAKLSLLQELPGVGRSTAGAILSLAFKIRAPILDGNVKRVLIRFKGIQEWSGSKEITNKLWKTTEKLTPFKQVDHYNQAMMDLGAMICTRTKPKCSLCPLKKGCVSDKENLQHVIPVPKPKKTLPIREKTFLMIRHGDRILLEKRPLNGIWAKLWSMPEIINLNSLEKITLECKTRFRLHVNKIILKPLLRHTLSHFHLDILPAIIDVTPIRQKFMEEDCLLWYNLKNPQSIGLPQVIKKIIQHYA